MIQTDANGKKKRGDIYDFGDYDNPKKVTATSDGGYISVGYYSSDGVNAKLIALKADASGNVTWERSYEPEQDASAQEAVVEELSDGGYIMGAEQESTASASEDGFFFVKTDAMGNVIWAKTFHESDYNSSTDVQRTGSVKAIYETQAGGYIAIGTLSGFYPKRAVILKIDREGALTGSALVELEAGIYTATAYSSGGFLIVGKDDDWPYLARVDTGGEVLWEKTVNSASMVYAFSVAETSDSGFVLCGWSGSTTNSEFTLLKLR